MTHFAMLLTGPEKRPTVVRLFEGESCLSLTAGDGTETQIAWWRLFRVSEEGSTDRFKRLDQRDWELRVTSGADRELLARVGSRPIARFLHPLRRLHSIKTLIGVIVIVAAIAQHFPAEWMAKAITPDMQHRLVDPVIAQNAIRRCSHAGGEEAVRKLLVRLDPDLGSKVRIAAFDNSDFMVTAAPANIIMLTRGALQETDPATMAALLAHQLSHLRHGDAVVGMVRAEGNWGIWGALLQGHPNDGVRMDYSGLEERRADLEAMAMLRAARIPIAPSADLFERIRVSRAQGTFEAYDYRDFHFGVDSRAKRWAEAAAAQQAEDAVEPALDRDSSDALFNFCWVGRIAPAPPQKIPGNLQHRSPGTGAMLPSR